MKTYEFGASLESVWRSLQVHKEIFAWCHFAIFFEREEEKNEFGEPPNSLQTLSKLKKNMRAQLFFTKNMRAATQ